MTNRLEPHDEFHKQGFTILTQVVSNELTARLFDQVMTMNHQRRDSLQPATQFTDQRLFNLLEKDACFVELLLNEAVLDVMERILGRGFVCSAFESNTIYPDVEFKYDWHVDYPYNVEQNCLLENPLTDVLAVQVIVPLVDFTKDNGGMAVIPFANRTRPKRDCSHAEEVYANPRRGDVLVGHPNYWHSSTINVTTQPRPAILSQFIKPYVVPQNDLRAQMRNMTLVPDRAVQLLQGEVYRSK